MALDPTSAFSIIQTGLFEKLLQKISWFTNRKKVDYRKILFLLVLTYLPLLILTLAQGLMIGDRVAVPFFYEPAIHIRLLMALPMLILSEKYVSQRIHTIILQFRKNGMVPEDKLGDFDQLLQRFQLLAKKKRAELIIIAIIVVNLVLRWTLNTFEVTTWMFPSAENKSSLSLAGYWAILVSFPMVQFLILRWLWRWLLWSRLLFELSKFGLRIFPSHPDKAGGLAFLGESPLVFGSVTLVFGVIFAAILIERTLFLNYTLDQQIPLLVSFLVLSLIINILPLLFFSGLMRTERLKAIHEFNRIGTLMERAFEDKYILQNESQSQIPIPEGYMAGTSYQRVQEMKMFPFDLKSMIASVVITVIPLLGLLLFYIPFMEVVDFLMGFMV
jgi:uncharacterized membrane protein